MSRVQKILLFSSAVAYALTLYAFLRLDMWLLLICFVIHSVTLIIFSFLCYQASQTPDEDVIELEDRLVTVKEEWKAETDELHIQLEEKELALSQRDGELAALRADVTKLQSELDQAHTDLDDAKAAPEEDIDTSILPGFLPDRAESATVSVIEIAKSVSRELKDDAIKAGVTITVTEVEEQLLVKADPNMLRILFRNIVDNAIKYMNRHGSLIITVSSIEDDIFIVCKDTGEGLAAEETNHIFELNYQGSNRISGNGLGLYQAKAIVTYYGGTIYAKSTPGKGMGIYIQLPTT